MERDWSNLLLYTYFRSSCSARLRIALELKGLPYDCKYVNLLAGDQSGTEYDKVNPSHLVPTLQIGNEPSKLHLITQSLAALEFLEEQYPGNQPLLPPASDILGRAQVRALANIIACDVQPVTNLRILKKVQALGGEREDWAQEFMNAGFTAYERLAATTSGKYSFGDEITLADVCLVPAVWGALRFKVDMSQYPTIWRISERMEEHEAVKKAHWKNQVDTPADLRL